MSGTQQIWVTAGSIISYEIPVTSTGDSGDPSAATPTFALGPIGASAPTTSYANGDWSGTYNATTGRIVAVTPTIGASGAALSATAGTHYTLWCKLITGGETTAEPVATIIAI